MSITTTGFTGISHDNSGNIPQHYLHTNTHEWIVAIEDGLYAVGISYAGQDMLGDIVFCGDALLGQSLKTGDTCAVVESIKAASDVHMPIDGEVVAFNNDLNNDPGILNTDTYNTWIVKIKPTDMTLNTALSLSKFKHLLSPDDYKQLI